MQGGLARHLWQGLCPHGSIQSRHARRHHPQGRRRQDAPAQQAHPHGLLRRGRRHKYIDTYPQAAARTPPSRPGPSPANTMMHFPHHSPVCRVHPSQRPALLDAQRDGPLAQSPGPLCPWRAGLQLAVAKALQRQPAAGRSRPHHPEAQPLLARLLGCAGPRALCRPRLRTVRHPPYPFHLALEHRSHLSASLTDTTASRCSTSTTTPISASSRESSC